VKPLKPAALRTALGEALGVHAPGLESDPRPTIELPPDLATRHPLRILLAEDNAVNQKLALKLLERMGYRADIANDGREAVDAVAAGDYDLVLMDVQMPEMDGLEATRAIVATHGAQRPQIVALTADAMQDDRERCLAAGMDGYLTKPIRPRDFAQLLERVATKPSVQLEESAIAALLENAGGDSEFVVSLLETFETEVEPLLRGLRAAAESGDGEALRRAAHTLKSNAATFGATALASLCAELEARAHQGDTAAAATAVARVEESYAQVRPALAALHDRLRGSS
jgi:CheY-like chemotaxis protein